MWTDVLRNSVKKPVDSYGYSVTVPVFRKGNQSVIVLMGKQDGSSYLPETTKVIQSRVQLYLDEAR